MMNRLKGGETPKMMHQRLWKPGVSIEEYQAAFTDPNVRYVDHADKWIGGILFGLIALWAIANLIAPNF